MANTLRENQIEQLRPKSGIAPSSLAVAPFKRTVDPSESRSMADVEEFVRRTAVLDPMDQQRVEAVDIYNVPGGSVSLFKGTGRPPEEVQLQDLPSAVYTGTGPIPSRMVGDPDLVQQIQTGEAADPRLQALIDQPDIAQIEQDLALVRNVDPARLKGDDLRDYEDAQERIGRFAEGAPPRPTGQLPQIVTMDQVKAFEQHLIQQQFGGVDPRTRNLTEEIMQLPDTFYQNYYNRTWWQPAMDAGQVVPIWSDLGADRKKAVMEEANALEQDRRGKEILIQTEAFNRAISDATTQAKKTETIMAQMRQQMIKEEGAQLKTREKAQESLTKLTDRINDATAELKAKIDDFGEGSPQVMAHRAHINELSAALARARRRATETKQAGAPERGGEPEPGAAPTEMTREQLVHEAKRRYPKDRQAALAWLAKQGVDIASSGEQAGVGEPSRATIGDEMFGEPSA